MVFDLLLFNLDVKHMLLQLSHFRLVWTQTRTSHFEFPLGTGSLCQIIQQAEPKYHERHFALICQDLTFDSS